MKEEDGNQGDGDVIEQIGVKWVNECGICMGVKKRSRISARKKGYERSTVDRQIKVPNTIARSVEHRYLEKHAVRKRESEGRKNRGKGPRGWWRSQEMELTENGVTTWVWKMLSINVEVGRQG